MSEKKKAVELKDEELEKVSGGGGVPGKSKYQKGESVFFRFNSPFDGTCGYSSADNIVAFGPIEDVHEEYDGFYYDIHHGYLNVFSEIGIYKYYGHINENTEHYIPEKDINLTGNFK